MLTIEQSGFFNGDRVELDDVADYFTVDNMRSMFPGECDDLTQDECDECAAEARTMIDHDDREDEDNGDAMSETERECRSAFELMGFNETETGGGCTAWELVSERDKQFLVTHETEVVLDLGASCILSVYDGQHIVVVKQLAFLRAYDFIAWLHAQCELTPDQMSEAALIKWAKE